MMHPRFIKPPAWPLTPGQLNNQMTVLKAKLNRQAIAIVSMMHKPRREVPLHVLCTVLASFINGYAFITTKDPSTVPPDGLIALRLIGTAVRRKEEHAQLERLPPLLQRSRTRRRRPSSLRPTRSGRRPCRSRRRSTTMQNFYESTLKSRSTFVQSKWPTTTNKKCC